MIAAVVLAAGASSRYGTEPPKQVELLPRVLAALGASSVEEIVVVSGAHDLGGDSVPCPDWERGPGASLRCGLEALHAGAARAARPPSFRNVRRSSGIRNPLPSLERGRVNEGYSDFTYSTRSTFSRSVSASFNRSL